ELRGEVLVEDEDVDGVADGRAQAGSDGRQEQPFRQGEFGLLDPLDVLFGNGHDFSLFSPDPLGEIGLIGPRNPKSPISPNMITAPGPPPAHGRARPRASGAVPARRGTTSAAPETPPAPASPAAAPATAIGGTAPPSRKPNSAASAG